MQYKKFKSVSDEARITTGDGHVMLIGREWRDVPEFLWPSAYAAGCLTEDMKVASVTSFIQEKKEEAEAAEAAERLKIKNKMKEAYANPVTYLDKKGNVMQRKIIALINRPIKKDLMDEIWAELVAEGDET